MLEGSVRKSGDNVRVTAQLIDAVTGHHVWAQRYDRQLIDIFTVQDELMREIVVALDVELREGEQARMWSSGTRNLEAWECIRLSAPEVLGGVPERKPLARRLIERALELDPPRCRPRADPQRPRRLRPAREGGAPLLAPRPSP